MKTAKNWAGLTLVAMLGGAAAPSVTTTAPPSTPQPSVTTKPPSGTPPAPATIAPPPNMIWSGLEEQAPPEPSSPAPPRRARTPAAPNKDATAARPESETEQVAKLNAWTLGLAGGQRESMALDFATDISIVVDDGDNLHVLPIVTRGPAENAESLLYIKSVDAAIIDADTLQQFEARVPDIAKKISYILNLFPSELQILARPEINTIDDLRGKKVSFNTEGTVTAYSGPLMFSKLKLDVQQTFVPYQVALEQLRNGTDDMAAVVFVASKPVFALQDVAWPPGFKLLSVPYQDSTFYQPAILTAADYPQLIPQGQQIDTIAVATLLAAYNWPEKSDRYKRIGRLVDNLFDRMETLQGVGFHPKWKDVMLNATVPGLTRFHAAQDWLDRAAAQAIVEQSPQASAAALQPPSPADAKLFQEFLRWRQNQKR